MAQSESESVTTIKPILLDKSYLSGVGLQRIKIKEEPEKDVFQKRLYRGKDISVYVVSSGSWINKIEKYSFDEFAYMLNGVAKVTPKEGPEQLFYTGDFFFAPKGYAGSWEIIAGKNYHYELSVITTQRADSTVVSEDTNHSLLDQNKISGITIDFDEGGLYETILQKGAELTVRLKAERPREISMLEPAKEQLIHVIAGQVTIEDSAGDKQTFYTGNFFLLPNGFTGKWQSDGHGMLKYMSVEKS